MSLKRSRFAHPARDDRTFFKPGRRWWRCSL